MYFHSSFPSIYHHLYCTIQSRSNRPLLRTPLHKARESHSQNFVCACKKPLPERDQNHNLAPVSTVVRPSRSCLKVDPVHSTPDRKQASCLLQKQPEEIPIVWNGAPPLERHNFLRGRRGALASVVWSLLQRCRFDTRHFSIQHCSWELVGLEAHMQRDAPSGRTAAAATAVAVVVFSSFLLQPC